MKIIYNNIIPFPGYKIINLFGVLFARLSAKGKITDVDKNHESIHTAQMKELLYIFFYIIYFLEWLVRLFITFSFNKAYREISFEVEAYDNQDNLEYLKTRKYLAQWRKKNKK